MQVRKRSVVQQEEHCSVRPLENRIPCLQSRKSSCHSPECPVTACPWPSPSPAPGSWLKRPWPLSLHRDGMFSPEPALGVFWCQFLFCHFLREVSKRSSRDRAEQCSSQSSGSLKTPCPGGGGRQQPRGDGWFTFTATDTTEVIKSQADRCGDGICVWNRVNLIFY